MNQMEMGYNIKERGRLKLSKIEDQNHHFRHCGLLLQLIGCETIDIPQILVRFQGFPYLLQQKVPESVQSHAELFSQSTFYYTSRILHLVKRLGAGEISIGCVQKRLKVLVPRQRCKPVSLKDAVNVKIFKKG